MGTQITYTKNNFLVTAAYFFLLLTIIEVFISNSSSTLRLVLGNAAQVFFMLYFFRSVIAKSDFYEYAYYVILLIGTFLHIGLSIKGNVFSEYFGWVFIVMMIAIASKEKVKNQNLLFILLAFFIIECLIGIYERATGSFVFEQSLEDELAYLNLKSDVDFRASGLMYNALTNANIVSIIMAFILCSKKIDNRIRYLLVFIGALAILSFNCRGSIIIWLVVFFYRLFLKDKSPFVIAGILLIAYLALPFILGLFESSMVFGRLGNLSDDSTFTRLDAFVYFAISPWSMTDILRGGRILYMPDGIRTLENGALVTLGYWGWIVGGFKILLELVITYRALREYPLHDRFTIMIAWWGVAMTNNLTFNIHPLFFFMMSLMAFKFYYKTAFK